MVTRRSLWISAALFLKLESAIAIGKMNRGLAYHSPSQYLQHWNNDTGSQVSWAYNWASSTDATFPSYLEYIPMLWSNRSDHTNNWKKNAETAIRDKRTKHVLAFNEPDSCYSGQSCMSVQSAVDAYRKYMHPLGGKALLGAPAVSNGPNGMRWLQQFLGNCTDCQIDFVPIHWYDQAWNLGYFRNYIKSASLIAPGKPIWITEFNANGTLEQQTTFLQTVLPWLDNQTFVGGYAWYWVSPNYLKGKLVEENGWPTPFGKLYAYFMG